MTTDATVVDCRWLSIGGPGRVTELLLRGLAERPPRGRWVLWGREGATARLAWDGAEVAPISVDPRSAAGQRSAFELPQCELAVFLHHQRPLRRVPSVTVMYDTIALRYGTNRATRALKRAFMKRVAAISLGLVTISEHSRASIVRDLGVDPEHVNVVQLPFDEALVSRIGALRRRLPRRDAALYVGNFLPHKNLPTLISAFADTSFCRRGGKLVTVGGSPRDVARLVAGLTSEQRAFVEALPARPQDELDRLLATAAFVVQPSLEEGFGLPAWEAISCGIPVAASDGGALPEVVGPYAETFPARSARRMARALDSCAEAACERTPDQEARQSAELRRQAPTVGRFAEQVVEIVDRSRERAGPKSAARRGH